MSEITTTLVVNFRAGSGGAGVLTAAIDSREDGFNNGKSSFGAGDSPTYLITKTDDVTVNSQTPSLGLVQFVASGEITENQFLHFPFEREQSLSFPAKVGSLTSKWIGTDLGAVTVVDQVTVRSTLTGVGVLKVTYQRKFLAYQIANVPVPANGEEEFDILVYITGTQA